METQLKFFKKDGSWYADVPNRTLEENEMVMGTDVILDMIKDSNDQVILKLSDEETQRCLLTLRMVKHDEDGAYYNVSGPVFDIILRQLSEKSSENDDTFQYLSSGEGVWICNVTHDVFGEHPKVISIIDIIQDINVENNNRNEDIHKQYGKKQCVYGENSKMICSLCSATCKERYEDFSKKGVKFGFIPTNK